jgi:hypothetical protein
MNKSYRLLTTTYDFRPGAIGFAADGSGPVVFQLALGQVQVMTPDAVTPLSQVLALSE